MLRKQLNATPSRPQKTPFQGLASRLSLGLTLLGLALALLWGTIWLHLAEVKRHEMAAALRDGRSMTRVLEQNLVRTIDSADQLLGYIQIDFRQSPTQFNLLDWLKLRPHDALSVQLAQINAQGTLTATSLNAQPEPVDLSEREHFRVHLNTKEDRLFISAPVLGRISGLWTIQLTRPQRDTEGRFAGVLVMSMDTQYLTRFYDAVRQQDSMVRLVGLDGIVRAAAPPEGSALSSKIPTTMLKRLETSNEGQFIDTQSEGVERITSYRKMQGYPLYVLASINTDDVLKAYRFDLRYATILGNIISLALGLTTWLPLRQAGRLDSNRQNLRSTLDNMSQGVIMADATGRIQVLNQQAQHLLDLEGPAAAPGKPIDAVLARAGTPTRDRQLERRTATGKTIETLTFDLPDGGLLLTATDVTEQRLASEAQTAARTAAEAANRSKSAFLANMSHEIRTPMNGVLGMLQALQYSGLTPQQMAMSNTMAQSGNALLRVVNDILDGAMLEARKLHLIPKPTNVQQLVQDAVDLMQPTATEKGLTIRANATGWQPPTVLLDPLRLQQIVTNLLSNAVKFSNHGTVTVELQCEPLADGHVALAIAVRDQGEGIASEALTGLFTPFTQTESGQRRTDGSSLGLAISRDLARLMGGNITTKSKKGEGSTFTIQLVAELQPQTPTQPTTEPPIATTPRPLDILIAEDNDMNRTVIRHLLGRTSHRLRFAHDGRDALEATHQQRFDVILMDAAMPLMDGIAATKAIRAAEANTGRRTPIIAQTAHAMIGDRERYLAAGMDGYVSKPIDLQILLAEIDRLVPPTTQTSTITQ